MVLTWVDHLLSPHVFQGGGAGGGLVDHLRKVFGKRAHQVEHSFILLKEECGIYASS